MRKRGNRNATTISERDDVNAVESGGELRRPREETAYALIARMERARLTEAAGSNPAGGTMAAASGHEPACVAASGADQ